MESTNKNRAEDRHAPSVSRDVELLKPEMTFLAENPEAFGLISDACPLATDHLIIAANGYSASGHEGAPILEMPAKDVEGLMETLYRELLRDCEQSRAALRIALGKDKIPLEYPISRYCAALVEALTLQLMQESAAGASPEQVCVLLSQALGDKLAKLKERLIEEKGVGTLDDAQFRVSLGVCRLQEQGEGDYLVDVISGGSFHVFLLDEQGMSPLWDLSCHPIDPDSPVLLMGRQFSIHHPEPFALLLVSESIHGPDAAEGRALQESKGLIWRYRMRLENAFLCLVTDCVHDRELGERATRAFMGRARGRQSASGGVILRTGGSSYEVFRNQCRGRLGELEKLIALFPKGYDPLHPPYIPDRQDVEQEFLRGLLERNVPLANRLRDALRHMILQVVRGEVTDELLPPPPEGVPGYIRPDRAAILSTFRSFDCENDADRLRVEENQRMLREILSEHWITLRPLLLKDVSLAKRGSSTHRATGERMYGACLDMNWRLSRMLTHRRDTVAELEAALTDSLAILRVEGNDWVCARAGTESTDAWLTRLSEDLPDLLIHFQTEWREDTERYRCLHAAYTAERERLFRLDTAEGTGFFAEDWQAILSGSMADTRWEALRMLLADSSEPERYRKLWDAANRISRGTEALLQRIHSRNAESRAARVIADRADMRVAGLRGAAYRDEAWGREVIAVLDAVTYGEFHDTVRRWEQTRELIRQQEEHYAVYSRMYGRYQSST